MHMRSSLRAQTDVPVDVYADGQVFPCRAVDLSTGGVVIERTDGLVRHDARLVYWLKLPFGDQGIVALARPAWTKGRQQGLRFIEMEPSDRLTLAEAMDETARRGMALH